MMIESTGEAALDDLLVLELGDAGVQVCGKLLADMGATVVKVEPPGGAASRMRPPFRGGIPDVNSSIHFWSYNTSKEAIILDLEREHDRSLLRSLSRRANLILEDLPVGYLSSLRLGYDDLSASDPRLIYVSISPFGQTGPLKNWRGGDLVQWAMGGAMAMVGYSDSDLPPLVPQADLSYQLAGLWASIGALAALAHRDETGLGQHVDVSVQEAVAMMVDGYATAPYEYLGDVVSRRDLSGTVMTSDRKYLVPQILNVPARRWIEFRDWLRQEGVGPEVHQFEPDDFESNRDLVLGVIAEIARGRSGAEMAILGQSFGFTWMPVNAPEDLVDDPQLQFRGFFPEVIHPELGQSYKYAGPAAEWSEAGWRIRRRPPLLGEDNERWLGGSDPR